MEGFLIAARFVHFTTAILLTGVFAFERFVADPTFQLFNAEPAGETRLRRRLGWLAWTSLPLAVGSGAVWLVVVAAGMSGEPLGAALLQGAVPIVLTRTQFGEDWLLRLAMAVLLGFCLLGRGRRRWRVSGAIGWTALFLAAAMLASLAWAGHGAATPGPAGDLHLAADFLHLLAAGLWLGTLVPLALLLTEARRIGDANWAAVAWRATRRYSALAVASVTVLLVGGLVNTWFLAGNVPALVGTEYGRLLLAKIGIFIAMLIVAAVNLLRLSPRLATAADGIGNVVWRTVARLRRNALTEGALGLGVLAIVGALGTLPPGLHTEPGWPFPFRLDAAALTVGSRILLAILGVTVCICAIAAAASAAAGRYRRMAGFGAGLALCLAVGWMPLWPAIDRAYPTSYYTPAEPYAAASIVRGASHYDEHCTLCHGPTGEGDGPASASLPIRPADLTEPHLFAHSPGDLFWWIGHGMDEGVMPGFADELNPISGGMWSTSFALAPPACSPARSGRRSSPCGAAGARFHLRSRRGAIHAETNARDWAGAALAIRTARANRAPPAAGSCTAAPHGRRPSGARGRARCFRPGNLGGRSSAALRRRLVIRGDLQPRAVSRNPGWRRD